MLFYNKLSMRQYLQQVVYAVPVPDIITKLIGLTKFWQTRPNLE